MFKEREIQAENMRSYLCVKIIPKTKLHNSNWKEQKIWPNIKQWKKIW